MLAQAAPAQVIPAGPSVATVDSLPSAPTPVASPTESVVSPTQTPGPITFHDRLVLQTKTTFGVSAFVIPVGEAAIIMADPPSAYPREWKDGAGALGRNYGAQLARHTASGLTHFAVAAAVHEDPRYYAADSDNYAARAAHALLFTVFDRSAPSGYGEGHRMLAVSNLAGATAGGFIGNAFLPAGFTDVTHAYQRGAVEVSTYAAHNLLAEFSPEIVLILHKMHIPDRLADSFLPADRRESR